VERIKWRKIHLKMILLFLGVNLAILFFLIFLFILLPFSLYFIFYFIDLLFNLFLWQKLNGEKKHTEKWRIVERPLWCVFVVPVGEWPLMDDSQPVSVHLMDFRAIEISHWILGFQYRISIILFLLYTYTYFLTQSTILFRAKWEIEITSKSVER
jgi:hypothetical protein